MHLGCGFCFVPLFELFLFVFYPFYLAMIKWERVYALVQGGVQDHEAISIRCSIFLFFCHLVASGLCGSGLFHCDLLFIFLDLLSPIT